MFVQKESTVRILFLFFFSFSTSQDLLSERNSKGHFCESTRLIQEMADSDGELGEDQAVEQVSFAYIFFLESVP